MKTLSKCLLAMAIGYSVAWLVGWGVGMLGDSFMLAREQLIDNDPRVLDAYADRLFILSFFALPIIVACGALAAAFTSAILLKQSPLAIWVVSGLIVLLGIVQTLLSGQKLWLCIALLAVWPGCVYLANRFRVRIRNAA